MNLLLAVAYLMLVVALVLFMYRLVRGPDVVDRVVALDGVLITIMGAILVEASRTGSPWSIDTVIVVALLGFVATGVLARFVEQRGGR